MQNLTSIFNKPITIFILGFLPGVCTNITLIFK